MLTCSACFAWLLFPFKCSYSQPEWRNYPPGEGWIFLHFFKHTLKSHCRAQSILTASLMMMSPKCQPLNPDQVSEGSCGPKAAWHGDKTQLYPFIGMTLVAPQVAAYRHPHRIRISGPARSHTMIILPILVSSACSLLLVGILHRLHQPLDGQSLSSVSVLVSQFDLNLILNVGALSPHCNFSSTRTTTMSLQATVSEQNHWYIPDDIEREIFFWAVTNQDAFQYLLVAR